MKNVKSRKYKIVTATLLLAATQGFAKKQSPNFVFIMCDQLTAKVLSCYGGPVYTPNIDQLTQNGVRFTQAICTTPFSSPSRASIVTGLYTHQHGIAKNVNIKPPQQKGIAEDDITFDKLLNQAGYITRHYGKWHLENSSDLKINLRYYPNPYTYDREYTDEYSYKYINMQMKDSGDWMDYRGFPYPVILSSHFRKIQTQLESTFKNHEFKEYIMKMGSLRMDMDDWHDEVSTRKTVDFIKSTKYSKAPFSITCSYMWPHDPNFIFDLYYNSICPDSLDIPEYEDLDSFFKRSFSYRVAQSIGYEGVKEFLRIYYATVKYLDDKVGEIVSALKDANQLENTIIIFTADHGDMVGHHNMIWKSTHAFFDEIVIVPLIVSWQGNFTSSVSKAQINGVDFLPTILELAGEKIQTNISGKSFVPLLKGKIKDDDFRSFNFSERIDANPLGERIVLPETKGNFMIKNDNIKYLLYANGTEFCYDLWNDPGERKNVIEEPAYKNRIELMREELKKWLVKTHWTGKDPIFKHKK